MSYILIIIVALIVIKWIEFETFHWKTIVKTLWKQIYQQADLMISEINTGTNETFLVERYKLKMDLMGNIINSIIDFRYYMRKERNEDAEEDTFGYGRYDFYKIFDLVKESKGKKLTQKA